MRVLSAQDLHFDAPPGPIAERLGFVREGVHRHAERIGDRYLDLVVYSVLADEWSARHAGGR